MDRKTEATDGQIVVDLVTDPSEIARVESQNALQQFDFAMNFVDVVVAQGVKFELGRDLVYELNRLATVGVKANAGKPRQIPVGIGGSQHVPPPWEDVTRHVDEMCQYVNSNWGASPIHLAAYLLWRINWVHPFEDGNGRTARMLSYTILCIRLGFVLPGIRTIPEQIASNKMPYYTALEAADAAHAKGTISLRVLETLLSDMLANQLTDVFDQAVGASGSTGP